MEAFLRAYPTSARVTDVPGTIPPQGVASLVDRELSLPVLVLQIYRTRIIFIYTDCLVGDGWNEGEVGPL